ncbi:hypothetical protein MIH18_10200 [Marinobacter sp. M3C]|jgi:hypothetical protein|uniref:hypothetical protein n=1 Tax=unclassified Marinobacter TaxID=83889 RepID=UPI00200E87A1|nr:MULTISPECIES: hypothetical protein [unclassified Marinobacter]MCL1479350.1 hypothetical protein [Marinobacter sp.]MCL1484780.1 hypothetical protein [Marinobacter sp.]UQG56554.1 hypothetical protein MIH16_02445 [Marinobacter sp. M4C]UQG62253.1 hypothetical protein MIH18_10200 [Marinobacter sp. M3C]UQG65358.1 hypothetical protein MIH17_02445 [Marinobacter sp. M2C]
MKKVIIAATLTAVFSTMENAHSGLADRINEERSYPNKTIEKASPIEAVKKPLFKHPEY